MIKISNKAITTIAQSIYDETFKPLKEKQDEKIKQEKEKIKLTAVEYCKLYEKYYISSYNGYNRR